MATTPLFLTVLLLAYHGKAVQELLALVKEAPTDQLHLLFHDYVERLLQRKGTRVHAPAQQTKHWLVWLARQLTAHYRSELYPGHFFLDCLPERQETFYLWSILLVGVLAGVLVGRLAIGLASGLVVGLVGVLAGVLASGLVVGLVGVLASWLASGLYGRENEYGDALPAVFTVILTLVLGEVGVPVVGLVSWLAGGLVGALVGVLVSGLAIGLVGWLAFFLIITMKVYIVRFWLWQARCTPAPWQYVAFLDDAVEQLLLRKVGRGYIFRHRLL